MNNMTYTSRTQGIIYRIMGYLGEDDKHEIYHGKSSNPQRHIILHLLKTGNGRRYPKAKLITEVVIQPPKSVGRYDEQVVPWQTNNADLQEVV